MHDDEADAPPLEDDEDQGPCPSCGKPVDPETGVCEACLAAAERDEDGEEPEEPDPEELARAEAAEAFLAAPHEPDGRWCATCLEAHRPGHDRCGICGGEVLGWADVERLLRKELDLAAQDWFAPVLTDERPAFFDAVVEAFLEAAPDAGRDVRVVQRQAQFDPAFGHCIAYQRLLFVRRARLALLRQVLERPDLADRHPDEVEGAVQRWASGHHWAWFKF